MSSDLRFNANAGRAGDTAVAGEADSLADEAFLAEVASFLRRAEPVPPSVVSAAKTAYGWRSVVAAVAELEFDSAVDEDDLARVRAGFADRLLRFRGEDSVLEVSIIDGGRRMVGRLDPGRTGSVLLRHPGRPDVATQPDELGRFLFERLHRGPMSIRAVPDDPAVAGFQTEWVTV